MRRSPRRWPPARRSSRRVTPSSRPRHRHHTPRPAHPASLRCGGRRLGSGHCREFDTGSAGGYLLTAYVRDHTTALESSAVEAALSPQVFVLGARNPELHRYDSRCHEHYPDEVSVAGWTRSEPPPPPRVVATGSADELRPLVSAAIDPDHLAQRPSWWPSAQPVAAGPITTASV